MRTLPAGNIRVGVGGWVYEPWRDNFYPPGLAHAKELAYLSERVTAIDAPVPAPVDGEWLVLRAGKRRLAVGRRAP